MKRLIPFACLAALAGCGLTSTQQSALTSTGVSAVGTASTLVSASTATKGQLFCTKATADGPLVVALADAALSAAAPAMAPVAISVVGMTSDAVKAACAAWSAGATPVVPPTIPVPTVAVVVPPTS